MKLNLNHRFEATDLESVWHALICRSMDQEVVERGADSITIRKDYQPSSMLSGIFGVNMITSPQKTELVRDGRSLPTKIMTTSDRGSRISAVGCEIPYDIRLEYISSEKQEDRAVDVICEVSIGLEESISESLLPCARPVLEMFIRKKFASERKDESDLIYSRK